MTRGELKTYLETKGPGLSFDWLLDAVKGPAFVHYMTQMLMDVSKDSALSQCYTNLGPVAEAALLVFYYDGLGETSRVNHLIHALNTYGPREPAVWRYIAMDDMDAIVENFEQFMEEIRTVEGEGQGQGEEQGQGRVGREGREVVNR